MTKYTTHTYTLESSQFYLHLRQSTSKTRSTTIDRSFLSHTHTHTQTHTRTNAQTHAPVNPSTTPFSLSSLLLVYLQAMWTDQKIHSDDNKERYIDEAEGAHRRTPRWSFFYAIFSRISKRCEALFIPLYYA